MRAGPLPPARHRPPPASIGRRPLFPRSTATASSFPWIQHGGGLPPPGFKAATTSSPPLDSWQRQRLPSPSIQRSSNVPLYSWQQRRKGARRLCGRRPGRCAGRGGTGIEEQCGAAIQLVNEMRPLPRPTATVALSNLGGVRSPSSFVTPQQRICVFVNNPSGRTIHLREHPSDTVHAVKAKMEEQFSLVLCATGLCATPSSFLLEQFSFFLLIFPCAS